jgi:hypothetical protein
MNQGTSSSRVCGQVWTSFANTNWFYPRWGLDWQFHGIAA